MWMQETKRALRGNLESLLFIGAATAYFLWFSWPLAWAGSENLRLVYAFDLDEAMNLALVADAVGQGTLRLDFAVYGLLYFNIALIPLLLANAFVQLSEQNIVVVLRLLATAFAIGTSAITFLLARRYWGSWAGWLAGFLLAVVPITFVRMSAVSHPDVPQLFFLVLSLYCCCRLGEDGRKRWLMGASVFAALAFATKYSGVFLLPLIWGVGVGKSLSNSENRPTGPSVTQFTRALRYVTAGMGLIVILIGIFSTPGVAARFVTVDGTINDPLILEALSLARIAVVVMGSMMIALAVLRPPWSLLVARPRLATAIRTVALSSTTFVVAFSVSSPFAYLNLNFLRNIYYQSSVQAQGNYFREEESGLVWLQVLASPHLLDVVLLGLAAISLVLTARGLLKTGPTSLLKAESILWLWVISYTSFLVLRVHYRPPHYLLPVVPLVIILTVHGLSRVIRYISSKPPQKLLGPVLSGIVLLGLGWLELPKSLEHVASYRASTMAWAESHSAVKAGEWLAESYPPTTRILYDRWTYVPPSFADAYETRAGGTLEMLDALQPDVIVVNRLQVDTFTDTNQAARFVRGEELFNNIRDFYTGLREESMGYVLARDFGAVQIYTRR